jgi:hypothetical protein
MGAEKKFTEYDQIGIPIAENVEIRREEGREHVVSIAFTRPDGSRHEAQVMSYGEPLSIFID